MCFPAMFAALGVGGGAAATAAGATSLASTIGTVLSIGGSVIGGIQGKQAADAQAAAIGQQRETEAKLTAVQDQRTRAAMMTQIAQQRAELAARGVTLDSPTAMALGQSAAQELSFESQSIRSGGVARDQELSASQRYARAKGSEAMLKGVFSAAKGILDAPPDTWRAFRRGGATA